MEIIKCRFLKDGEPMGKEYSYLSKEAVAVGDTVQAETQKGTADLIVTAVNVPEKEVESFKDKLKYITGKKPLEKKVYVEWAFKKNEEEKRHINAAIFREICEKYNVKNMEFKSDDDLEKYDIVLARTAGYNHSTYRVIKNSTNLSQDEIALVCDHGSLCFGYTMENKDFYIFED